MKTEVTEVPFRYRFENKKIHTDFKIMAINKKHSMQDMITIALSKAYPAIFKG